MLTKTVLSLTFIFSVLLFGNSFIQAQTSPPAAGVTSPNEMPPLPKLKFPEGKSFIEVPFEVEGSWVVIPVSINGSRQLRFVFDSGASGTVLFNPTIADSINLKFTGTGQVRGAGGGGATFEIKIAENVGFNIGGMELSNGSLAQRPSNISVDGVIGRVVFATTVVEIDWEQRTVRFYEPSKYKYSGSGAVLPLTFDGGGRPYTTAAVSVSGEKAVPVKLVVDTGGSHALFLELASPAGIKPPDGATKTYLGTGGSGEITGFAGRVKDFQLGNYSVKDVPVGFLDASGGTAGLGERDGNLGNGVLRRFKVIYDYSRRQMIVEPNKFANAPFGFPREKIPTGSIEISPAILPDYVGRYGNKEISIKDGGLYYQRIGGSGAALKAVGKDKFALRTDGLITFIRDGKEAVTEMLIEWVERDQEQLKRETKTTTPPPTGLSANPSLPQNPPPPQRELSRDEQEVRELERQWLDAYEKRDADAMNRILSDDFTITQPSGAAQTKADIMKELNSPSGAARPTFRFSTDNVTSQAFGETVILTGRVTQQLESIGSGNNGGQVRLIQARYTDVYVKKNGQWQVVASQLSRIAEPQQQQRNPPQP